MSYSIDNTWKITSFNWNNLLNELWEGGIEPIWNDTFFNWGDTLETLWGDLRIIGQIADNFIDLDGSVFKKIKRRYFKTNIKKLKKEQKESVIRIYCKLKDKEFTSKSKKNKKIILTVESMQFVIQKIFNVNVELI